MDATFDDEALFFIRHKMSHWAIKLNTCPEIVSVIEMKIFLDDERIAPEGWMQARWPDEVIILLQTKEVSHLSLDHDLGDDQRGTGYDVLSWIENELVLNKRMPPAHINVHSANPAARVRMVAAIEAISRMSKLIDN